MQLIFGAENTEISCSIVNQNKMTSIDQGSNGEKFDSGFITEANQQNYPEESKEEEICPEVPKEEGKRPEMPKLEGNCPEVQKLEENCPKVPKKEENFPGVRKEEENCPKVPEDEGKSDFKCPKVPKDNNVQDNSINMDNISNKNVSNESQNANDRNNEKTRENCVTDDNVKKIVDKEYALKVIVDSVEATKIDTVELAESSVTLPENNFETTKDPFVTLDTLSSDEKHVEDVKMSDKGIEEDNAANKHNIELTYDAISTNHIFEEAIENTSNDRVMDDCMAGAQDSKIKDTQIEEKLTEDTTECPVEVEQLNTKPHVINQSESLTLKPEFQKHVSKITDSKVKNVNSEVNIHETEILNDSVENTVEKILDKPLESMEIDKNALDEPLRFEDSLEIDKNILDEDGERSVIPALESASEHSINTQSVHEELKFSDETKSSEAVTEKPVEEKLIENEIRVENICSDSSDTLSENVELGSKSSDTVAKTSSSEAIETKSDESISSDDIIDGKTSTEELDYSKKYDVSVHNTVESETPALDTIIEETKSADIIPESSKSEGKILTINVESAEKPECFNVDDIDMEPPVTDTAKEENMSIDCDDSISFVTANDNDDVSVVSDSKEVENPLEKTAANKLTKETSVNDDTQKLVEVSVSASHSNDTFKIKLSNNLDILSDDEEDSAIKSEKETSDKKHAEIETPSKTITKKDSQDFDILSDEDEKSSKPLKSTEIETLKTVAVEDSKDKTINLEDDDDIMLIDDDTSAKVIINQKINDTSFKSNDIVDSPVQPNKPEDQISINIDSKATNVEEPAKEEKEESEPEPTTATVAANLQTEKTGKPTDTSEAEPKEKRKPLVPQNFFKSNKKNLSEMSRDDLEEFCILKIVESIVGRSTLNETKTKLKIMTQTAEEYKKKALSLIKQNRDLQVVLKSVQEEQKNNSTTPIAPLKLTRSVGMQVLMTDKNRRKPANLNVSNQSTSQNNAKQTPKPKPKPPAKPPKIPVVNTIPVPRLVPASNVAKVQVPNKPMTNGIKTPPVQKPEKRTHSKMTAQSVIVDLTDDEPPAKVVFKSPGQPVRLVPPQTLMSPRGPNFTNSSPRKVFIPVSGSGTQQLRPGQTIMVKNIAGGPRQRNPNATIRSPQNAIRVPRPTISRHPAPLPDATKQYQPATWKALPPAPDLKLSKVENGIVISWKIENFEEDSYEEIASYQLFAYQVTHAPPTTNLWKKIGDVKALPLPMSCTLTQCMAGYKYYFAVRAVDIRSRLGPFSMPGSIILVNKL